MARILGVDDDPDLLGLCDQLLRSRAAILEALEAASAWVGDDRSAVPAAEVES